MGSRIKRSDFMSSDDYARALRREGLDYQDIRKGVFYGTGPDAEILRATFGDNPEQTLSREVADRQERPHVFEKKWSEQRRGKIADDHENNNPFHPKK